MENINSSNQGFGYITSTNDPELKDLEKQLKMWQNKLGGKRWWWPFSSGGRRYKKKRSTKRKKSAKRRTRRS
jgi:hypothetical protein